MATDGESFYRIIELFNKVTRPILQQPDWENIIKIVDIVNAHPHSASDLIIPKMMEVIKDEKNPKIVWLSLIVIDSCVKNCCEEFIGKICNKEFMRRMKKIIYKRYIKKKRAGTPTAQYKNQCGEKAAHMVQAWGIAFHSKKLRQRYPLFFTTYKHCVNDKGVRFPEASKDDTPVVTHEKEGGKSHHHHHGKKSTGGDRLRESIKNNSTINPKIQEIVNGVRDNVKFLSEMLKSDSKDPQTIEQIVTAIKEKQALITSTIQNTENENVTSLLLQTFEEAEAILKKFNKSDNNNDENSDESNGDDEDSVTNTKAFDAFTQTDDTFLKMHIEPNKSMGNDFFIQDLVKSNNPFLDSTSSSTQSSGSFFNNSTTGSNNSFLGTGSVNSSGTNQTPPQNYSYNFGTSNTSSNTQFNPPQTDQYNFQTNGNSQLTTGSNQYFQTNTQYNPNPTNNQYNPNPTNNQYNPQTNPQYNPQTNQYNPQTNPQNVPPQNNGQNNFFNTSNQTNTGASFFNNSNGGSQTGFNNPPLDLFGTNNTKTTFSANDPFENLFSHAKGPDGSVNISVQTGGNVNPFNNNQSKQQQYNNPFL
jgi:hypothetical protein